MTDSDKGFVKDSVIFLFFFGLFNFLNFLFQLIMARSLDIVEYGVLATLFSILYILNVFSDSIQLIITKYSSSEKTHGLLKNILKRGLKKSFVLSIILLFFYLIIS